MNTLRGKLTLVIILGISTIMLISTIVISMVINNNLKKDISEDMKLILNYSKEEIMGSINIEGNANDFLLVDGVGKLFNCYIGFEDRLYNYNYAGKIKNIKTIEKYKGTKDDKRMLLTIDEEESKIIGTTYYPLYGDGGYEGKIIIQKEYTNRYLSYIEIRNTLIITQMILFLLFTIGIYFIIRKSTKPLEALTKIIKSFGEGIRENQRVKITNDEIGTLSKEFEVMEEKIAKLQNESKDFFNRATHELKTPLTAIKGYSELLCDEAFEDEFIITAIERVNEESNKMTRLVENLLTISRQDTRINIYKECVEIEQTVASILKSLELMISAKDIDVDINLESKVVETFKVDFEIIINNLINNSIKYSSCNKICITSEKKDEKLIFKISNEIDIKKLPKKDIFKPFIKEEGQEEISSSGLGLYICKRICEKNDWKIEYEINDLRNIVFKFEV